MRLSRIFLCLAGVFLMLLFSCGHADKKQTKNGLTHHWSEVGTIPDINNKTPSPGLAGSVAGISNNRLLIGGGSNFPEQPPWEDGSKAYYDALYVYQKQDDSLILLDDSFKLPNKIAYSANVSTEEGIVVAGGEDDEGPKAEVLLINWNDKEHLVKIDSLPDLPQPLTAGSISAIEQNIYFAGGQNKDSVSNKLYHLDLAQPEQGWENLPDVPKRLSHSVLAAQKAQDEENLFLVGGRKSNPDSISDQYKAVYRFDLKKEQWFKVSSLPHTLSAHTGVLAQDSLLMVFSGDRGETFKKTEEKLMKISEEEDATRKNKLIKEKNEIQKTHPGFAGRVLTYNTKDDQWKKTDSIPFPGQVTTTALQWGDEIIIPGGEIKAGIRTPKIIVGKPEFN